MIRATLSIFSLAATAAFSQQPGGGKAALQERLAQVKQSVAQNQARLRQFGWTETTEVSLKGEVKKREQNDCMYGPDGKIQKNLIGEPAPPPSRRGIKGRIVEKKVDELKDYMDRVGSLVKRYLPPDPQQMQAAFQAGKALLNPVSGELMFRDYVKPGDTFTFIFDTATKKVRSIAVGTYLDAPKDTVTVDARFNSLPDGTNYLETTVLDATAKQIQIKKTNFGYRRIGG